MLRNQTVRAYPGGRWASSAGVCRAGCARALARCARIVPAAVPPHVPPLPGTSRPGPQPAPTGVGSHRRSGDAGFTLLEVLVAFAIAAAALAALTQGALGGLQSVRVSGHVQEAVARARSRLAVLGHAVPLAPGEQEGDDGGGFRWRQRVTPVGDPQPAPTGAAPPGAARPVLLDVSVAVSWRLDGRAREVVLRTRRLGLLPPEPP